MPSISPSATVGKFEVVGNTLFTCPIKWIIAGYEDGYIVQHIQRNEKFESNGKKIVSANEYWESWEIVTDAGKTEARPKKNDINDNFGVYIKNTTFNKDGTNTNFPDKTGTKGKWKIKGTVYYVPKAAFEPNDWNCDKADEKNIPGSKKRIGPIRAVPEAGYLPSRYEKPVPKDGLTLDGKLGAPVCTRKFAGTWDYTGSPKKSDSRGFPMGACFKSKISN